ncbi:hypothetical protein MMC18_007913 [Xylographa bjoerkii]|nr:hypothetical protein [Xylographa bjoerkii]
MHASTIVAFAFAAVAFSQVSEITDGQAQAPTSAVAPVSEFTDGQPQETTASSYSNALTSLLSLTNSLGVVTGMPPVATSMPAVITSMPAVATSMPTLATSQTVAATFVSGSPGIPVPVTTVAPVVPAPASSGFMSAPVVGMNTTVTSASLSTVSVAISSTAAAAGSTTSAPSGSAAGMIQPALGLGLVAGIFAALL